MARIYPPYGCPFSCVIIDILDVLRKGEIMALTQISNFRCDLSDALIYGKDLR